MKQILRKHAITLLLLFLGGIVGLILFFQQPAIAIWRVEYEFKTEQFNDISPIAQYDTLVNTKEFLVRNYTSSIADTLRETGVSRHELKVYGKEFSTKEEITSFADKLLNDPLIAIINTRYRETQRKKRVLLNYMLGGFFLGMLIDFFLALKKKPNSQNQA